MKRLFGGFLFALILLSLVSVSAFADALTLVSAETGYSDYYYNEIIIKAGEEAALSVIASGDIDGISYRWYRYDYNWSNYEELSCTDAALNTGKLYSKYYYYCTATNSSGYSASCSFRVQIDNGFSLKTADGNAYSTTVSAAEGSSVTLKVKPTGDDLSKISYRWRRYPLAGGNTETLTETSDTLVIPEVTKSYTYYCESEDGYGNSDSVYFYVKVENHFSISANGSNETWRVPVKVADGGTATLSVLASGDDLRGIKYNWRSYRENTYDNSKDWEVDSATLTTDPITEPYWYECTATDRYGNTSSVSFLVSVENHFSLVCDGSRTGDDTVTILLGDSTVLKVKANGDDLSGVAFSWSRYRANENTEILAETGPSLSTEALNTAYRYQCTATDKFGNREYCSFQIRIENHFSASPANVGRNNTVIVEEGSSAVLQVNVQGDDLSGVTYRWGRSPANGSGYENLGEASAMLNTGALDVAYNYNCNVTDKYGNTAYCYFNVQIENHFSLTANISSTNSNTVVVPLGGSTTIGVLATADDPTGITYEWSRYSPSGNSGNTSLSEKTATITTGALDQAYNYQCRAVDKYGNTEWCTIYVQIENHFSLVDENTDSPYWDTNERFIALGGETTMTVVPRADDTTGITYQWIRYRQDGNGHWFDQTNLGTSPSQETGVQNQTYHYRCNATDKYGNTASCYYRVSVQNHLSVVSTATGSKWQDSNRVYVEKGQTTTLSVRVSADDLNGITYQWFAGPSLNNNAMSEITGPTESITTQPINEIMYYRCVVTDCYGTTEYCIFSVCVQNNLQVVTETGNSVANVMLSRNQTRSLTAAVTANDTGGITYQWYKAPQRIFYNNDTNWVACGNEAVITSDPASVAMAYRCDVTDCYGTVAACWYYIGIQNHFGLKPVGGTRVGDNTAMVLVNKDTAATLAVEAYGDDLDGVTYEWREAIHIWENNGVQYGAPIKDAEGPSLTTPAIVGYRNYRVWATDRYGNIASFVFDISVSNGVVVEAGTDRFPVVSKGSSVTMEVSITGNTNISCQWYTNEGGNGLKRIPGATGTSCTRTINQNCNIIFIATDEYGMDYPVIFVPATSEFIQSKPLLKNATSISGGVSLEWDPVDGAAAFWIQRMTPGENEWTNLDIVVNSLTYCDTTAVNGSSYSYRLFGGYSGQHKTQASDVITLTHQIIIPRDKVLQLPEGLTRIESEAFVNVRAEGVVIPSEVTYIADDAFNDIVIIGDSGKEAEQYASRTGKTFIPRTEYNTWP